jgi:hypothetical protein
MSPSVMIFPAGNFKFLTEVHLQEREIIAFAKKSGARNKKGALPPCRLDEFAGQLGRPA